MQRRAHWLGALLLAAALLAAYQNSFRVPYLLDDEDSITRNPTLRSVGAALFPPGDSGSTVSGRPLLNFSLALNRQLTGDNLAGYHAGNLLIHFAAALCLCGVVRRTLVLPSLAPRYGAHAMGLAWAAAALWALHPLQTESVTYLIQRAESLVGLCYLFTLYAFIRGVAGPSRGWRVAAVVGCFLGMAAKEVMASAPLVLFLYDRTFVSGTFQAAWQRHRGLLLAFASGWLLLLACVVSSGGRGSTVGFNHLGSLDYLLMQGPGVVTYLGRAVWPAGLVFDYGAVVEKRPLVLFGGVLVAATLFLVTLGLLRRRPATGFIGAWFFLILAPSSSFIPVATQTLAEHRLYLPLAAVTTTAVLLLHRLGARIATAAIGVLLLAGGFVTHDRNHDYRSSLAIWEDTVSKVPDNARALYNLALFYHEADRLDEAVVRLEEAIDIAPNFADAHANLGAVRLKRWLRRAGRSAGAVIDGQEAALRASGTGAGDDTVVREALAGLQRAYELAPAKANLLVLHANALIDLGRLEAAVPLLARAIELKPDSAEYRHELASLYLRLDRAAQAEGEFQAALRLVPDRVETHINYGVLLRRQQRLPEAIEHLSTAVRLEPGSARGRSHLGIAMIAQGAVEEGIRELEASAELDPKLAQTHFHLGHAYLKNERLAEAIRHFETLLTVAPPTAELRNTLGVLYARADRTADALAEFQRAVELDPTNAAARENLVQLSGH